MKIDFIPFPFEFFRGPGQKDPQFPKVTGGGSEKLPWNRYIRAAAFLFFSLIPSVFVGANEGDLPIVTQPEAQPSFSTVSAEEISRAFESLAPRPRILLTDRRIEAARKRVQRDPVWADYFAALEAEGKNLLKKPPLEYHKIGVRLLSVSREALHRIYLLSFLDRYGVGEGRFAKRAEEEMTAVSDFTDWNPSHFLDVAEMTTAVAIGYDSLFAKLAPENREKIGRAILEKGIKPSLEKGNSHWVKNEANWNQVCHGGMAIGALAVADENPTLARDIVRRSVNGVTWSMASYEPDGNYTEGPSYWGYGTSYNILLLMALSDALSTDFGRSASNGLLLSVRYYENVFGPTGDAWNYPDSGGGKIFEPGVFWFAEKLDDPSISWNENRLLAASWGRANEKKSVAQNSSKISLPDIPSFERLVGERLSPLPLLMVIPSEESDSPFLLSADSAFEKATMEANGFVGIGNGQCPVALFRTSWTDPTAAWLGIKAGTPRSPHGHMDSGSFVYERDGVRWAVDLGAESYNKIESRGMNLWNSNQNSDRWKIFRYNNYSHNTLTVGGALQKVDGRATFTKTTVGRAGEESSATIDLTPVYSGELANAQRDAVLKPDKTLEIIDTLSATPEKEAVVQWRMMTPAVVETNDTGAILRFPASNRRTNNSSETKTSDDGTGGGTSLTCLLHASAETSDHSPLPLTVSTEPARTTTDYDSENRGISMVIVTLKLAAGESAQLTVRLE